MRRGVHTGRPVVTAAGPRPSGALGAMLDALGWSCEHLARQLNEYAGSCGLRSRVHAKTPYKWVRGAQPASPWPALTATLLTRELGRPVLPADLGWSSDPTLAVPAAVGLDVPWDAGGALRALWAVADAGPMDRRVFLLMLGAATTEPAHEWLLAHQAGSLTRHTGSPLPETIVDDLDAIAARLRTMDDRLGGGPLLNLIGEQIRYVTGLIDQRRYSDHIGRRLHSNVAELLRLAGWSAFETGQHPRAQRYWTAALHAAQAAGDRALGANVLGFMSCQAKDIGQVRQAVTLAETARAGYPGGSPKVAAILDLRVAEAQANANDATATQRAIDDAFNHLSQASSGPVAGAACGATPAWAYWLDEAHANGQAGYCHLRLGNTERARSHLRAAIRLQTEPRSREAALRHTLLATGFLNAQQPDLDQAVKHGGRAVDILLGEIDSPRCAGHVNRMTTLLRHYQRHQPVRQLLERAQPLTGATSG
ncbi:MAG: hypothetical protein JXA67_03580 [Micromonosporaceae bacterium]|nr:hypothetical protein [Micromonosporaceae bacterium]